MTVALAMAARLQQTIDWLAASKARTPSEVHTEARLRQRLNRLVGDLVDRADTGVRRDGIPGDEQRARGLLGELGDLEEELVVVLTEEVGEEAARAIATVENKVGRATKDVPDDLPHTLGRTLPEPLREYGMNRRLWGTMSRLGKRMLGRFTNRTVEAMVNAADVDMPRGELSGRLRDMLDGELTNLARQAVGDVRNEATVDAERDLGVQRHRWITAGDDAVRLDHADVAGEVAEVGDTFSNGRTRPGGLGCRCRLEPVLMEGSSAA